MCAREISPYSEIFWAPCELVLFVWIELAWIGVTLWTRCAWTELLSVNAARVRYLNKSSHGITLLQG